MGKVQAGLLFFCRTSPTIAQCLTCSFCPSQARPGGFSNILLQMLGQSVKSSKEFIGIKLCNCTDDKYQIEDKITSDVSRILRSAESTRA